MKIHIADSVDLERVFALRVEVFVREQNVPPELELDPEDKTATHIIAEDGGSALGCARVIFSESDAHIGRLAVAKAHRKKGIGRAVCQYAVDIARQRGYGRIWLNAQLHAVPFYEALGFARVGERFFEAGIEHIRMEITL